MCWTGTLIWYKQTNAPNIFKTLLFFYPCQVVLLLCFVQQVNIFARLIIFLETTVYIDISWPLLTALIGHWTCFQIQPIIVIAAIILVYMWYVITRIWSLRNLWTFCTCPGHVWYIYCRVLHISCISHRHVACQTLRQRPVDNQGWGKRDFFFATKLAKNTFSQYDLSYMMFYDSDLIFWVKIGVVLYFLKKKLSTADNQLVAV